MEANQSMKRALSLVLGLLIVFSTAGTAFANTTEVPRFNPETDRQSMYFIDSVAALVDWEDWTDEDIAIVNGADPAAIGFTGEYADKEVIIYSESSDGIDVANTGIILRNTDNYKENKVLRGNKALKVTNKDDIVIMFKVGKKDNQNFNNYGHKGVQIPDLPRPYDWQSKASDLGFHMWSDGSGREISFTVTDTQELRGGTVSEELSWNGWSDEEGYTIMQMSMEDFTEYQTDTFISEGEEGLNGLRPTDDLNEALASGVIDKAEFDYLMRDVEYKIHQMKLEGNGTPSTVYIDDIRLVNGPVGEDVLAPVLDEFSAQQANEEPIISSYNSATNTIAVKAFLMDNNYFNERHVFSDIDTSHMQVFIDDKQVDSDNIVMNHEITTKQYNETRFNAQFKTINVPDKINVDHLVSTLEISGPEVTPGVHKVTLAVPDLNKNVAFFDVFVWVEKSAGADAEYMGLKDSSYKLTDPIHFQDGQYTVSLATYFDIQADRIDFSMEYDANSFSEDLITVTKSPALGDSAFHYNVDGGIITLSFDSVDIHADEVLADITFNVSKSNIKYTTGKYDTALNDVKETNFYIKNAVSSVEKEGNIQTYYSFDKAAKNHNPNTLEIIRATQGELLIVKTEGIADGNYRLVNKLPTETSYDITISNGNVTFNDQAAARTITDLAETNTPEKASPTASIQITTPDGIELTNTYDVITVPKLNGDYMGTKPYGFIGTHKVDTLDRTKRGTSFSIQYYTHSDSDYTNVEYMLAKDYTEGNWSKASTWAADVSYFYMNAANNKRGPYHEIKANSVTITGLQPGEEYVYRVLNADKTDSSDEHRFITESASDEFSFILLGDSQVGGTDSAVYDETFGQSLRESIEKAKELGGKPADFIMHIGDLIENGTSFQELDIMVDIMDTMDYTYNWMFAPGNHDTTGNWSGEMFSTLFDYGQNSYGSRYNADEHNIDFTKFERTNWDGYGVLHGNVAVAHMNSDMTDYYYYGENVTTDHYLEEQFKAIEQFFEEAESQGATWKIINFHQPVYGGTLSRSMWKVKHTDYLTPENLERLKVDFIVGGHDHSVSRTKRINDYGTFQINAGISGRKNYDTDTTQGIWDSAYDLSLTAEDELNYNIVEIEDDKMTITVFETGTGHILDKIQVTKAADRNIVENLLPPMSVSVNRIPSEAIAVTIVSASTATELKVLPGRKTVRDFDDAGKDITSSKAFAAFDNGVYSIYASDVEGRETIRYVTIEHSQNNGQAAPTGLTLEKGATSATAQNGAIAGTTDEMEYRLSTAESWTRASNEVTSGLGAGIYYVRYASETALGGIIAEIEVPVIQEPGSPGVIPTAPPLPPVQEDSGRLVVEEEQLSASNVSDNQVKLELEGDLEELVLPGNTAELLANKALTVQADNVVLTIPSEVLKALSDLVDSEELGDSEITLKIDKVLEDDIASLLDKASEQSGAAVKAAGEIFEFTFTLTTKDNKTVSLSQFDEPIKISLLVSPNADKDIIGIYYIADDGMLDYRGGTMEDGKLAAFVDHFSKYAVLEYDKQFTDVPSRHWAASVIRELAAKHLVEGVSKDAFQPERKVNRAEFTAMLVRLLGIEGKATNSFTDVSSSAWYANDVAIAAEHGIVNGVGGSKFAPEALISRQEMAAMIVRSYEVATGKKPSEGAASEFADIAATPEWAQSAINTAHSLGLVNGKSATSFEPLQNGTRAESAMLIFNLLNAIE
ncbi:S-layer homology domain-containing protein [Paenibacillus sp. PAMC21692]|uniref:S-layer homology domain-containing protein n=1 Tax=Paenibacillus sp. PAMC21692 TaxID=2762320 RepID=UPI00164D1042|nr:S-layer homology domain-containing protein [Paenibacillus sp. PAMC21692]QNK58737.1 S-layer homology domain-containing protein [Paenibacillus sp. PAMC21692]